MRKEEERETRRRGSWAGGRVSPGLAHGNEAAINSWRNSPSEEWSICKYSRTKPKQSKHSPRESSRPTNRLSPASTKTNTVCKQRPSALRVGAELTQLLSGGVYICCLPCTFTRTPPLPPPLSPLFLLSSPSSLSPFLLLFPPLPPPPFPHFLLSLVPFPSSSSLSLFPPLPLPFPLVLLSFPPLFLLSSPLLPPSLPDGHAT